MAVIYADHLIQKKQEFQEKLKKAEDLARQGTLNIIEVIAKEPNTSLGYVKIGEKIEENVYVLDSFTEKPSLATAKKFLESGNYLWNTGIYVWKAKTLLDHYKKLIPKTYEILQKIAETGDMSDYETLEKISIDYAIMEKVDPKEVRIIKSDLGWSDIGTFSAVWEELSSSPDQNVTRGEVKTLDSSGCLIYGDSGKPIAAIGLKDIIIVDTKDGLLICKKEDSKRIKEILN